MTTYVVLLRGINVGTSNRIAMADLRALLVALGFADVRTLLNSGNVVLTAATDDGEEVADRTRAGVREGLGLAILVVVRSRDQLERIVEDNPLCREADQSPKAFHVGFCLAPPAGEVLAAIDGAAVRRRAVSGVTA